MSAFLTGYFPVWVAIACIAAVVHPPSFLWFRKDFVTAGLALTMLAMGTTLSLEVRIRCLLHSRYTFTCSVLDAACYAI